MSDLASILDGLSPHLLARLAIVVSQEADIDCDNVAATRHFFQAIIAAGQRNCGDKFPYIMAVEVIASLD